MRFLTDPVWIGAIAALLAIILPVVLYAIARKKKSLFYEIISENPLISIGNEIKGQIKILFNDKPIENVNLLLIRFTNDGNQPITASDYERPISLRFKDNPHVLSAEFADANPPNLITTIEVRDKQVVINPVLMNSGDYYTVKLLVGEYSGKFDVDARVVGVKGIRAGRSQDRIKRRETIWKIAGLVGTLLFGAVAYSLLGLSITTKPRIHVLESSKTHVAVGERVPVFAAVEGGVGELTYEWSATNGQILGTGPSVSYVAPDSSGVERLQLSVIDHSGRKDSRSLSFEIASPSK
jgi:hypothetical protein